MKNRRAATRQKDRDLKARITNRKDFDCLLAEHGANLHAVVSGDWDVHVPAGKTIGSLTVSKGKTIGNVSLDRATVKGKVWMGGATVEGYVSLVGATVKGKVSLGGATVKGYVSLGSWACKGTELATAFAAGPLLKLLAACPGGVTAAAGAWGNSSWETCPLHDALGIADDTSASFKDVDKIIQDPELRLYARVFVPLHDAGLLAAPEIN